MWLNCGMRKPKASWAHTISVSIYWLLFFSMLTICVALTGAVLYLALKLTLNRKIPATRPWGISNPSLPYRRNPEACTICRELERTLGKPFLYTLRRQRGMVSPPWKASEIPTQAASYWELHKAPSSHENQYSQGSHLAYPRVCL